MTIYLVRSSPNVSRHTFGLAGQADIVRFGVAPNRVCRAAQSPVRRWALTSPFHPYLQKQAVYLCCTIPEVAFGCR